jgi:hypothetical protein
MLLAGIQANFGLDPRLKHSGVTTWGKVIRGPLDTPQLAAGLFIFVVGRWDFSFGLYRTNGRWKVFQYGPETIQPARFYELSP